MIINHNMGSINANRMIGINQANSSKSMEKLSSGLRINRAGDDAAGLAISEKMRGQIRGLDQASANSQDAISLIQTAEGALNETTSILQRMRELAVQGSNDTLNSNDRGQIQKEMDQLTQEIDRIGNTTEFNTKKLLNGGAGIQATVTDGAGAALAVGQQAQVVGGGVGVKAGGELKLTGVEAAKSASLTFGSSADGKDIKVGTAGATLKVNGVSITLAADATGSDIADEINKISGQTGVTASYTAATAGSKGELKLETSGIGSAATIDFSNATLTDTGAATDSLTDTASGALTMKDANGTDLLASDIASTDTTSTLGVDAKATIDAATTGKDPSSVTAQGNVLTFHGGDYDGLEIKVDATKTTAGAVNVNIDANNTLTMQIGANESQTMNISVNDMRTGALGVDSIDVSNSTKAGNAITTIQSAIDTVSGERSKLGAYQNRLEHTIANLGTSSENLTSAESRIRDVDMAKEMSTFSKNNILAQAAQSMLAQANQQPQQVLQLLQ